MSVIFDRWIKNIADSTTPEVLREFGICATDAGYEVIFPGLDGFFNNVSLMIVERNKLIGHARVCDGFFVCGGYFVVLNLSSWDDPTDLHEF